MIVEVKVKVSRVDNVNDDDDALHVHEDDSMGYTNLNIIKNIRLFNSKSIISFQLPVSC